MKIGIPKEIKKDEYRVGATPLNVAAWVEEGHEVLIQAKAGEGSGFLDIEYIKNGAVIIDHIEELYAKSTLIVKIKEPQPLEYDLLESKHILFCYLHLAPIKKLGEVLVDKGVSAIAYETVTKNGELPLLKPMSEIAGKSALLSGAHHLSKYCGGEGVLIGGALGVQNAKVLIIGAGVVGTNAAKYAVGLDADVTVINRTTPKLEILKNLLPPIKTKVYSESELVISLYESDIVISTALIQGGSSAPKLITKQMLPNMKKGSVFVDVAIDQGGTAETSKPTSHSDPTYTVEGVIHYCVANIPGAYPKTSTQAITNATAPYVSFIAKEGFENAVKKERSIYNGVNVYKNSLTNKAVADSFGMNYNDLDTLLD
ncbi:MAG: alanine dehydrogenase [Campylobacterota bacterium]|nr:alanine dehydrogenase [Campylobacterota bacterium]